MDEKRKHYLVYQITNLINNKIYIGIHITENVDDGYMGSGYRIKNSIKKYGIENFKREILFDFDNPVDMIEMERNIVNEEFVNRSDTYNQNIGGGSFYYINKNKLNNSVNQQLIVKNRLLNDSEFSEYFKNRIISGLKKYYLTNPGTFTGKSHSEETKRIVGEKNSKHQKGTGNSQFGTMWSHNTDLKENKKIKKDEIIPTGWKPGRKMKF